MKSVDKLFDDFRSVASEDGEIWDKTLVEIQKLGCAAVEPLLSLMACDDVRVRGAVIDVLSMWTKDQRVVAPLISELSDKETCLRGWAAITLGCTYDLRAVEPLIKLLSDENPQNRRHALGSLSKIGGDTAIKVIYHSLINDVDSEVRDTAVSVLSDIGRYDCLMSAIDLGINIKPSVKAKTLVEMHDENAFDFTVSLLDSSNNTSTRNAAVNLLAEMNDKRAIQYLHGAINDSDWLLRLKAGKALYILGDPEGMNILVDMLRNPPEDAYYGYIIFIAQSINDPTIIKTIADIMSSDGDSRRRHFAAFALQFSADDSLINPLISALEDGIGSAAIALGNYDNNEVVDILIKALDNEEPLLRMKVIKALTKNGGKHAVEPIIRAIEPNDPYYNDSIIALGKIGDKRAVDALIIAIGSDDAFTRRYAAWALSRMHDPLADKVLCDRINDIEVVIGAYSFFMLNELTNSEMRLINALSCYGHKAMAEDFVNSSNDTLMNAGREWLNNHPNAKYLSWEPWGEPSVKK